MIRVMIVDDKPENLYLLGALLRGHACVVDEARHGAEALAKARQIPPDLIVSDLLMPVMDGYTLLRRWKADARLKGIPFVVYTATYTEPKDERLALDLGADAFILKPAEPDEFMARIQELLAKAHRSELAARAPDGDGEALLKDYGDVLIRKLEEKALQLQEVNQTLREELVQRQQAEEALQESLERFQLASRATFSVIWDWNLETDALWWNENFQALFGYSAADSGADIESWTGRIHPEDRARVVAGIHAAIDLRRDTWSDQYRFRRQDGTYVEVEDRGFVARDAKGRPVRMIGAMHDITDRKRLEAERLHLEAQLRQHQKLEAIGTLASGVAHEINNPINGIMNYAELIATQAERGGPIGGYAQEIIRETERVATIVRNLLQFARQEKQAQSPARPCDIVEATLSLIRAVLRRDQIALTVDVPADLPPLICRSQQLQQVLMNLLTNARDALNARYPGHHENKRITIAAREVGGTPELRVPIYDLKNRDAGSPIASRHSEIAENREAAPRPHPAHPESPMEQRRLRITVADQGIGIPPEIRDRIFDPFFTTKPRDQGTGLGLSISHGIVQEHQGRLTVASAPGEGTQFYVELPLQSGGIVASGVE